MLWSPASPVALGPSWWFLNSDVILGLPTVRSSSTIGQLGAILDHLGSFHLAPFVTGLVVILAATACTTWAPRVPAPLVGIVLAVLAAKALSFHVGEIGVLPSGLPPFVGFAWSPQDIYTVLPAAFGLAFVTSVNVLITSRVVEHFRRTPPPPLHFRKSPTPN